MSTARRSRGPAPARSGHRLARRTAREAGRTQCGPGPAGVGAPVCDSCARWPIAARLPLGCDRTGHRAAQALDHAGFRTVEQVAEFTGDELAKQPKIGPAIVDRAQAGLTQLRFTAVPRTVPEHAQEPQAGPESLGDCELCACLPIADVLGLGHDDQSHWLLRILHLDHRIATADQLAEVLRSGEHLAGIGPKRRAVLLAWLTEYEAQQQAPSLTCPGGGALG